MKLITILLLIVISEFLWFHQSSGQEKINISSGFGIPELLNMGIRYQYNQTQMGISLGTMPFSPDESIVSFSGDIYYHFGGFSRLSNRRPWYGRIGLNYLRNETDVFIDKYYYLNTRIGRDFNISRKVGIQLDAGAVFQLHNKEIRKKISDGWDIDLEFPVFPGLGLTLLYKI